MRKKVDALPASLRWIFRATGKWKWGALWLLLTQVVLALLGVGIAWLYRDMVNCAVERDADAFPRAAVLLALAHAAALAFRALLRFLREDTESGAENAFKARLFSTLLSRDFASVTAVHSGEWMNRLTSDASVVAKGVAEILPDVAGMLVQMAGAMVLLAVMIPGLMAVLLPCGAALMVLTWAFRPRLKRLHREQQEADGQVRVRLQDALSSLLTVRAFSQEDAVRKGAVGAMELHRKARLRRNRFANVCNAGFGTVMNGARVAGSAYCAWRILRGEMSYGTLVAVMQLIGLVQSPFANVSGYAPRYYAMLASAERLMEAEFWEEDCPAPQKTAPEVRDFYRHSFTALSLRRAAFSYRSPDADPLPVLRNVSLSVRKGEFVALTGVSGRGKSTLLKLFLCLYPLDDGERSLLSSNGAIPLDASWRRLFAYVPQGAPWMAGSVREAVASGDADAAQRDADIWGALTASCAAGFVRARPEGLDARLGERGQGLSEGQLQRLAIARAVFSGRPVLLLDEATSALDEALEADVLRNLRRMTDCTVFIVTHRPAALDICDREIRLTDNGVLEIPGERERRKRL